MKYMKNITTITTKKLITFYTLAALLAVGSISYVLAPVAAAEEPAHCATSAPHPKGAQFWGWVPTEHAAVHNAYSADVAAELIKRDLHYQYWNGDRGYSSRWVSPFHTDGVLQRPDVQKHGAHNPVPFFQNDLLERVSNLNRETLWGIATASDARRRWNALESEYTSQKENGFPFDAAARIAAYKTALDEILDAHGHDDTKYAVCGWREEIVNHARTIVLRQIQSNNENAESIIEKFEVQKRIHTLLMKLMYPTRDDTPTPPPVGGSEDEDENEEEGSDGTVTHPNPITCTGSVGSRECRGGGRVRTPSADTHIVDVPADE